MSPAHITLTPTHQIDTNSRPVLEDGLRIWVSGEPGSGKSNACMGILEQAMKMGMQVIVFDAHGEYGALWGVRPTKTASYGYGSAAVTEESVDTALMLVAEGSNLLIDLSHWSDLEPAKLDKFTHEFMRGLYSLRRRTPRRTLVLLEEAQSVVPQQQSSGQHDNIKLMTSLITGGRKFGINFVLASQRPSLVDHNIVAACNVRLFLRTSEQKDWKRMKEYLPPKFPVSFGGMAKTDIKKFKAGEAILISRWFDTKRIRLPLAETELRRASMVFAEGE
jgi:DNA helicase HerA-like ATPase